VNGVVSVFFKTFVHHGAVLPYSKFLKTDKTTPQSLRVVFDRSHRELDEIALGKDAHAGRADTVEPFLEKITNLTVYDGRRCATATLVDDETSGWVVAIYNVPWNKWSRLCRVYGLIRPRTPRHSAKNA
jgi:hypothetical protein